MKARITIETTSNEKNALEAVLQERGWRIPEWFQAQVEELSTETAAIEDHGPAPTLHISSLDEIRNPKKVLSNLSRLDWAFAADHTRYFTHDVHPYPAKFIPQIPRTLIANLSLPGEVVFDPFGGSGTTALESLILGRRALSTDVHPLAELIGRAKTVTLNSEEEELLQKFCEDLIALCNLGGLSSEIRRFEHLASNLVPPIPNIEKWFHPIAISELAHLKWKIQDLSSEKCRVLGATAFSKSILKASYQDEETRYARRPREMPLGSVCKIFVANLRSSIQKRRKLGSLLRFREATFKTLDLREATVGEAGDLRPDTVDLVVTSPPYPNTTDYHLYHRFRLYWLGFDPKELARREIGSHLRHQKEKTGFASYLDEMSRCLAVLFKVIKPGRYGVFILGDGVFEGIKYDTADHVTRLAVRQGFEHVGFISRPVHLTKRSFVLPGRRLQSEKLVVLRRPPSAADVVLIRPPYKLWPYEERMRVAEIGSLLGDPGELGKDKCTVRLELPCTEKVRRLTFTHGFRTAPKSKELTWQAILENGDLSQERPRRKDPKYATHGLHPYKGKFYPQLAKSLFNIGRLSEGMRILDPFCGSGTVLLEGYLNGLRSFGMDVNPLAVKIARVKTEILHVDPYFRDKLLAQFERTLDRGPHDYAFRKQQDTPTDRTLSEACSWFPKAVLAKLGWILAEISRITEYRIREFLEVLVSSLVREISHQEPRDLRIRRREKPLIDAPVVEMLRARLLEQRTRLRHFAERAKYSPHRFYEATAIERDSSDPESFSSVILGPEPFDGIVTSPPYATALPYIDTDRLSILLLFGMNARDRGSIERDLIGSREITTSRRREIDTWISSKNFSEIPSRQAHQVIYEVWMRNMKSPSGFRRQNTAALLYLYFRAMSRVFRNLTGVLKDGAPVFVVIGDNKTTAGGKEIVISSGNALIEIGESLGLKCRDAIPITVTTENKIHSKNSITKNSVLYFEKTKDSESKFEH